MKKFKITLAVSQVNSKTITADTKRNLNVEAESLSLAKSIAKKQYKEIISEEYPGRFNFCKKIEKGFEGIDTVYIFH